MIMSRETLKRIAPYIEDCLVNLYTAHEDVEIGRCVRKFAGVSCTWNYEVSCLADDYITTTCIYDSSLRKIKRKKNAIYVSGGCTGCLTMKHINKSDLI